MVNFWKHTKEYKEIYNYLRTEFNINPDLYQDPKTGEINSTKLAEAWIEQFWDEGSEVAIGDETHLVWQVAVDIAEEYNG